ncbi:MAG: tyrosine-type recombinase/integrase [Solirubrobacterales bacterium]|nr:tyrosine-type recombinase/integrase [Solirubrobacterales bacterium]
MSALPALADVQAPVAPGGLGAAAERYARLMLRKSAQTQATYMSTYRRFADWLAHRTGQPDPPPAAVTADIVAAYISELEARKAPATVKKERAAINRLAKYLHTVGAIDATEILMIEGSRAPVQPRRRDALDAATWKRVKDAARARLHQGPRGRTSKAAAHRDLALILVLGEMGLRSEEARVLMTSSVTPKRADGLTPWLTVHGKGAKTRELPIPPEVADALLAWLEQRERIVPGRGIMFPRLGRRRADGSFPDAAGCVDAHGGTVDDGRLSPHALRDIVRPVMLGAGVPAELVHPHVLRHTYGTLFMARPDARIEQLQKLMGHADISTTAVYLHQTASDLEAAVLAQDPARATLAADAQRRSQRARARARRGL